MALVSYGSSDDSAFSEEEDNVPVKSNNVRNATENSTIQNLSGQTSTQAPIRTEKANGTTTKVPTPISELLDVHKDAVEEESDGVGQISDEEELSLEPTAQVTGLSLPAPKNTLDNPTAASAGTSASTVDLNILAGLPKPKATVVSSIVIDKEDELEEFVKKKETPIEKPPPKKRLPVKITIPTLSQNDSDEEDDAPSKKKTKFTSGSSLFSMLPAPQHAPIKEKNRSLVPHSLTKRSTKPLTPIPKTSPSRPAFPKPSMKATHLPGVPEDDSDEEESSGGNFFSLGQSSSKGSSSSVAGAVSYMSNIASTVQARPMDVSQPKTVPAAKSIEDDKACETSSPAVAEYVSPSDAPLAFKSRDSGYQGHWGRTGGAGVSANQMYNMAHVDAEGSASVQQDQPDAAAAGSSNAYGVPEMSNDTELTEEEQMMRLAGKRQFRREEVNIIDVNQEDQVDRAEMLKNISEEDGMTTAYASHKEKDLPGGVSKRKHQITYLGHLAKARELDLKNQWSQNKMSRRQSAMKYGF